MCAAGLTPHENRVSSLSELDNEGMEVAFSVLEPSIGRVLCRSDAGGQNLKGRVGELAPRERYTQYVVAPRLVYRQQ